MVAMSGAKFVDSKDVDEMESGRAAGAHTPVERGILAERRKEARRQKRGRASSGRDAPAAVDGGDSDNGLLEPPTPWSRRPRKRKAVGAPAAEAAAAATVAARRILELENEVLQQRNRALMAELSAERVGRLQGVGGASADPPPTAHFGFGAPAGFCPPGWPLPPNWASQMSQPFQPGSQHFMGAPAAPWSGGPLPSFGSAAVAARPAPGDGNGHRAGI